MREHGEAREGDPGRSKRVSLYFVFSSSSNVFFMRGASGG